MSVQLAGCSVLAVNAPIYDSRFPAFLNVAARYYLLFMSLNILPKQLDSPRGTFWIEITEFSLTRNILIDLKRAGNQIAMLMSFGNYSIFLIKCMSGHTEKKRQQTWSNMLRCWSILFLKKIVPHLLHPNHYAWTGLHSIVDISWSLQKVPSKKLSSYANLAGGRREKEFSPWWTCDNTSPTSRAVFSHVLTSVLDDFLNKIL